LYSATLLVDQLGEGLHEMICWLFRAMYMNIMYGISLPMTPLPHHVLMISGPELQTISILDLDVRLGARSREVRVLVGK
jgi:hypothetical protein